MGRIAILSASLGAGHDGAAREIADRLRANGHDVVRLDFLDFLPWRLGRRVRTSYRRQLAVAPATWEWLLGALHRHPPFAAFVVWLAASAARALLHAVGPDIEGVVCTYPLASQLASRLRRQGRLHAPVITYPTDPSVHPLWIADGTDLYLAAHPDIAQQLRALGARAFAVVDPAVRSAFRPPSDPDERARLRARLGLPGQARLALVMSGSWAVGEVEESARDVATAGAVPVVVCGDNTALRERLANLEPGVVLGWVEDMPDLLRACDVAVLVSGGLTFFEAHATGLPVLSYRCLAGHGRTNARSLQHAGLARWVHDRNELADALDAAPQRVDTATGGPRVCPAIAIAAIVRSSSTAAPHPARPRRVRRRIVWAAAAIIWLLWALTGGTSFAVAHGFLGIDSSDTRPGQLYLIAELPTRQVLPQPAITRLVALHAAAAVSVASAGDDPHTVQRLSEAGVLLVNAGAGQPYQTGLFRSRGAVGAAARAITRLSGRRPELLLSDGDLDAVDVSTAARYDERFVIPTATIDCAHPTLLPPRGGIVLVRQDRSHSCDLDAVLADLSNQAAVRHLHTDSLRSLAW